MATYKERKEKTKVYVILEYDRVLGVFSNLSKAARYMKGKGFYSYSTLSKMKQKFVQRGAFTLYEEQLR